MSEHDLRLHGLEERHERAKHAEIEARSANVEVGECDACGAPKCPRQHLHRGIWSNLALRPERRVGRSNPAGVDFPQPGRAHHRRLPEKLVVTPEGGPPSYVPSWT